MKADVGPERERTDLAAWEADAFTQIADAATYTIERKQLSYLLMQVRFCQGLSVQDGFQRSARKMWRYVNPAS